MRVQVIKWIHPLPSKGTSVLSTHRRSNDLTINSADIAPRIIEITDSLASIATVGIKGCLATNLNNVQLNEQQTVER